MSCPRRACALGLGARHTASAYLALGSTQCTPGIRGELGWLRRGFRVWFAVGMFPAYHSQTCFLLVLLNTHTVGWWVIVLAGWPHMAPTSSFSQFFASSVPPPPTNAFDSMRARVGSAITPAAQNAQAMQATVLPEKNPLCPNMSFKDRVRGCIGCMCIGMVLSFLGFMAWWGEEHSRTACTWRA